MHRHKFTAVVIAAALLLMLIGSASAQAPVTVSAQAVELAISVTDGIVEFGAIEVGGNARTGEIGQTQSVTNNSSVGVQLLVAFQELAPGVYGADCTGDGLPDWSPMIVSGVPITPGAEQFALGAGNMFGGNTYMYLSDMGIPATVLTTPGTPSVVTAGQSEPLDYSLYMPSQTVQTNPCTINTLVIAAVAPNP